MSSGSGFIVNNNRALLRLETIPNNLYRPLVTLDLVTLKIVNNRNLTMPQGVSNDGGLIQSQNSTFTFMISSSTADPTQWSFQLGLVNTMTGMVSTYMTLLGAVIPSGMAMDPSNGNLLVIYFNSQSGSGPLRVSTFNLKTKTRVSDVAFPCPLYPSGMSLKRAVQGSDTLMALYHPPSKRIYTIVGAGIQMFDYTTGTCTVVANASCTDFAPKWVNLAAADPTGNAAYLGLVSAGTSSRYCFETIKFNNGNPGWKTSVSATMNNAPAFRSAIDIN